MLGNELIGKQRLAFVRKFRIELPGRMNEFEYARELSWAEFARVRRGLMPLGPGDRWLIFHHRGLICCCRSGNGRLVYAVRFLNRDGGFRAVSALAGEEPPGGLPYYGPGYDRRLLDYLIDRLLLDRPAAFPLPAGLGGEEAALLERICIGAGRTSRELGACEML